MMQRCIPFEQLSLRDLYDILNLRNLVFVVEQSCPYHDTDYKDLYGWHLMWRNEEGLLVAYTRLLPEGISYNGYTSIGRVVNHPSIRGRGIGRRLMENSVQWVERLFGCHYPIKIGAQCYLQPFYESLGFETAGSPYMEDGIPHVHMIRYWPGQVGHSISTGE